MPRLTALFVLVFSAGAIAAGDVNEAATARKLASIRNQPLALEAAPNLPNAWKKCSWPLRLVGQSRIDIASTAWLNRF